MARKSSRGEIPRGAVRTIILTLLVEGPNHGYRLCKMLEGRTDGAFKLSEGSLYPILHELELEGLVKVKDVTSETGRKRRVYHLTRSGRKEAEQRRAHWLATAELMVDLLSPAPS
ncbi:MAG: helix-turn-helix transcriptional regulator [Myxococcota bacterium]